MNKLNDINQNRKSSQDKNEMKVFKDEKILKEELRILDLDMMIEKRRAAREKNQMEMMELDLLINIMESTLPMLVDSNLKGDLEVRLAKLYVKRLTLFNKMKNCGEPDLIVGDKKIEQSRVEAMKRVDVLVEVNRTKRDRF